MFRPFVLLLMQQFGEGLYTAGTCSRDNLILGQMGAKCIDQGGSLTDWKVTRLAQHENPLLLPALYCDEAHVRSRDRLADCLCVSCIGLSALHIGFDVCRRRQPNIVPQFLEFARPVMGRRAGFHPDQAWLQSPEKSEHLPTPQFSADCN